MRTFIGQKAAYCVAASAILISIGCSSKTVSSSSTSLENAILLYIDGRYEEAAAELAGLTKQLRNKGDLCTAYLYLGRCHEARGDYTSAGDAFTQGQMLGCGSPFGAYLGRLQRFSRTMPHAIRGETTITRAQLASLMSPVLAKRKAGTDGAKGGGAESSAGDTVPDIVDHPAIEPIVAVLDAGAMDVLPDGRFHPEALVTRAAFYVAVGRLIQVLGLDPALRQSLLPGGFRAALVSAEGSGVPGESLEFVTGLDAARILDELAAAAGP